MWLTLVLLMQFDRVVPLKASQHPSQKAQIGKLRQKLREPMPPENQPAARDSLAKQQADAAIALLKLGHDGQVWPLLRHSSDDSRRTYLINGLARLGANPSIIIRRLKTERDVSVRRALILSLAEYTAEQLPESLRRPLISRLLRWYRLDPDPGLHAAIDWLMRYVQQGETPRKLNWHQADALAQIDYELAGLRSGRRQWYVTKEGQTMTIVRGSVEFQMGSPEYEAGRVPASDSPRETLHLAHIPRSFSIANKEVTIGQFQRFLDANPEVKAKFAYLGNPDRMARVLKDFSPDPNGPQIAVTWYEAAMYCNWLSKQEGIAESEWVYPTSFTQIKDGMVMPKDYLHKIGYRLPTEAEWEYAARAGSVTARFYGTSDEMLQEYAWYSKNPPKKKSDPIDPSDPNRAWPVGQLKPNDFGLFDVYGNVWEWCQDRMREDVSADAVSEDREDEVLLVSDKESRSRRGGAFPYGAADQRSANRDTRNAFPILRRDNVGFRVARTYS
jgi:formylglycine-generating enzyme required for sulfatase activity